MTSFADELDWYRTQEHLVLLQLERLGGWVAGGISVGHLRSLSEAVSTPDGLAEVVRDLRYGERGGDGEAFAAESTLAGQRAAMTSPPPPLRVLAERLELSDVEVSLVHALWVLATSPAARRLGQAVWHQLDPDFPRLEFLSALLTEPGAPGDGVTAAAAREAPLRRLNLIDVGPLRRTVTLPDRVAAWLVDGRVARRSPEFFSLDEPTLPPDLLLPGAAAVQVEDALSQQAPRVLLLGPAEHGVVAIARGLAARHAAPLLVIDLERFRREGAKALERLADLLRDAALTAAWVLLQLGPEEPPAPVLEFLRDRLGDLSAPLILAAEARVPWIRAEFDAVPFVEVPRLAPEGLTRLYRAAAPPTPAPLARKEVNAVFSDYRISALTAIAVARAAARRAAVDGVDAVDADHVRAACRNHVAVTLSGLASRLEVGFTLTDLVLPGPTLDQVREITLAATHRSHVMGRWGFQRKYPYGAGLTVLFSGPSGTGKTMAACVIARELGRDIYRVDLSQVFDRYVGETEKNLGRIFDGASAGDIVLLFDEADALFSKRTEVRSSNDRYANLEVNYLLQRMESYAGIAILTTNLDSSIDDAFRRRIRHSVRFPEPDEAHRERLWRSMMTPESEVAPDINWGEIASAFELSGGGIKNAVLRAAFLAAGEGKHLGREHLWRAGLAECSAAGKLVRG